MAHKQTIRATIFASLTVSALTIAAAPYSYGFSGTIQDGASSARGAGQTADLFGATGILTTITNVLLFVIGAISVIMIIFGGLRYVISGGNTANVTAAKNTIMYAIIGLIVALLGYAIVNFVLASFSTTGAAGGTNV